MQLDANIKMAVG